MIDDTKRKWTKVVLSYSGIYRKNLSVQTEQNHGNLTTTTEHEGHLKEATLKDRTRVLTLQVTLSLHNKT